MRLFWDPDYLKDAQLVTKVDIVDCLFKILGDPIASPEGAVFTYKHILASQSEKDMNMMRHGMLERFDKKYCVSTKRFNWKKGVGNCVDITRKYFDDMRDGAEEQDWERGICGVDLCYISKSLAKDPNNPWSGFHSAPALFYRNELGQMKFQVRQPPQLDYSGAWQYPGDEVKAWVRAPGMS